MTTPFDSTETNVEYADTVSRAHNARILFTDGKEIDFDAVYTLKNGYVVATRDVQGKELWVSKFPPHTIREIRTKEELNDDR